MVAWLITMVPGPTEEVITILNYRLSDRSVGAIMERLYIERRQGLSALVEYAKTGIARYPWKSSVINGIPCSDELYCGSGDRIFWARKVDDLRIVKDENGKERLSWVERRRQDPSAFSKFIGSSDGNEFYHE